MSAPKTSSQVPRVALTREEAAQSLGIGVESFRLHVQPDLRVIRRGRIVLIPLCELEKWCETNATRTL